MCNLPFLMKDSIEMSLLVNTLVQSPVPLTCDIGHTLDLVCCWYENCLEGELSFFLFKCHIFHERMCRSVPSVCLCVRVLSKLLQAKEL